MPANFRECLSRAPRQFAVLAAVLLVITAYAAPAAQAGPIVYSSGELDLSIGFAGGSWELGWHDEANGLEFAANEVLARFLPASLQNRPAGNQWSFLGVPEGQPIFVLPQVQNPAILFPGLATEEVAGGIFDNDEVFLELVGLRGPGAFSIWATDGFGQPTPILSTSGGLFGPVTLFADSHVHFNWALSRPGLYELDFRAFGFENGVRTQSEVTTFTLEAQAQAIPEPASLAIFGLALAPLAVLRRRKQS